MDVTENYPSLLNCLETGKNGLFLDLPVPSGGGADEVGSGFCIGPFSKTIPARIQTDEASVIQQVHLVLQRDRYDAAGSLLPVNKITVETAWQNAFAFHLKNDQEKAPSFFKQQVDLNGQFQQFPSLFHCRKTKQWFHPVCPQCGLTLTLCRDDALLEKRSLPTYSETLERFLYCGSCATLSDSSPFYCLEKATGMPDIVHAAGTLVNHWKQLLAKFPDDTDLPCRGCPDRDACYGPESLVSRRIVPFSFFPFYMMMFPAPSCLAAAFIPLISGDTAAALPGANNGVSAPGANRFLFQDQDRQFLEILYFLGAVWFRTLLVNSRQQADTVYAEVERLLRHMDIEKGFHALEIEPSEPLGVFAGSQIFWVPDQRNLAENWQAYWKQAIRMGFELVDAGMKTGVSWDLGRFLSALDALRNKIRAEMFSGPAIKSASEGKTAVSDKISVVLNGILRKWQVASEPAGSRPVSEGEPEHPDIEESIIISSAKNEPPYSSDKGLSTASDRHSMDIPGSPPEGTDWEPDIQETLIFSSASAAPPSESMQQGVAEPQLQESQWNDDIEETVVLRTDSTTPSARPASSVDDMERTVVISAPSTPPGSSLPGKEEDLAATMIQNAPVPPAHLSGEDEGDLEATVVLNASDLPDPNIEAPSVDDDLAAP